MDPVRFVWRLVLSPAGAGAAGLYLAYEGLMAEHKRSSAGIVVATVFLVVSSVVNYVQEQSLARRMARTNLRLTQRLTALIGSLGEISGGGYEAWKVDLYTAHWRAGGSRAFPWFVRRRLVKQAAVSIISTVGIADSAALVDEGPLGRSFETQSAVMWFAPSARVADALDCSPHLKKETNAALEQVCGAIRTVPLTNHLDADCLGVVAVHVEPRFAPRFAGTMVLDECGTRLRAAALDLHQIITG